MGMCITICDDDMEELKQIENFCNLLGYEDLICCTYVESLKLVRDIQDNKIFADVYILDIDMPKPNGIEVKNILSGKGINVSVIFLTNHVEMMEEAFGRNVIAFVQKSNWKLRLKKELEKLHKELQNIITVTSDTGKLALPVRDIISVNACDYYSQIRYWDRNGKLEGQGVERRTLVKKTSNEPLCRCR